jgi:cytidine deaminase
MAAGGASEKDLARISPLAWKARNNARVLGATAVGCVVLGGGGQTWVGCNVEHKFRSHDIHAETNAISNMIVGGEHVLLGLVIAAERARFTPCGACLDWIWEFGGPGCLVGVQRQPEAELLVLSAHELMPYYPS